LLQPFNLFNLLFPTDHQRLPANPIWQTTDIVRVTNFCTVFDMDRKCSSQW